MALFDVIVVGSGPAGVMAAWALQGKRVLVLDVGRRAAGAPGAVSDWGVNLYDERRRRSDLFDFLIGEKFESLHNLHRKPVSLKLKPPMMQYVTASMTLGTFTRSHVLACFPDFYHRLLV